MRGFKKSLLERALGVAMSYHLNFQADESKPELTTNHRNDKSAKTVLTSEESLRIDISRDREGLFEPQIIGNHERRFTGFNDKILAMYASGMTVHEIQGFLIDMYAVDVSPDLISSVTDAVMTDIVTWQTRTLEQMYQVVFFDAMRVKIRDDSAVRCNAVYLVLGILPDGSKDILGIWIENTEAAKFRMKVFNELKTRVKRSTPSIPKPRFRPASCT
jgi:putative transposase